MKFRTIFLKDSMIDISAMSKYAVEEVKEYVVAEFSDETALEFYEDFKSAFDYKSSKLMNLDTIDCVGEDSYIYFISSNGIEKQNIVNDFSMKKIKKIKKKLYRQCKDAIDFSDRFLADNACTNSVAQNTLSKYKKRTFVSKENNIAFAYRIKKSKRDRQPIVIFFHGGGSTGTDNFKQLFEYKSLGIPQKLKNYDCTIIIPQTPINRPAGKANSIDYLHSVKQLSELIADEVNADKNRIYILGASFGGFCTWYSAYKFTDYYACAIPLMGQFEECYFDEVDYSRLKDLPIWIGHSSDDNIVDIKQDDIIAKELKKCSGNFRYTRYDKYGHGMARKFINKEIWAEWMFNQSLDER